MMEYRVDDRELSASIFIPFVNRIWPGRYDAAKTQIALSKTRNISAYDDVLVGCLRILSDGYYFGTITELLVLPEYRRQGVAADLMNHLIQTAKARGKKGMILTCKDRLIHYYEKFGYRSLGISGSVHGGAVWYDMLLEF